MLKSWEFLLWYTFGGCHWTSVFLVSHCRVLHVYSSFLLVVLRIVYTALLFIPHDFPFLYVA
jgi:hypothetical protein